MDSGSIDRLEVEQKWRAALGTVDSLFTKARDASLAKEEALKGEGARARSRLEAAEAAITSLRADVSQAQSAPSAPSSSEAAAAAAREDVARLRGELAVSKAVEAEAMRSATENEAALAAARDTLARNQANLTLYLTLLADAVKR